MLEPVAPEVTVEGQLGFCEGGSVILSGPENGTWSWNVGADSQSIEVATSSVVQLTFTDACGNANVGEEINVDVYPIPAAPTTEDITIENPAEVSLNAVGENLLWYENEDDVFCSSRRGCAGQRRCDHRLRVERVAPGTSATGAKSAWDEENGQHHTNSAWLVFDAYQGLTIERPGVCQ